MLNLICTITNPTVATLLDGVIALLGTIMTALIIRALAWMNSKAKTEQQRELLDHVRDLAFDAVAFVDQTLKPQLKAALADGKLTSEEKIALRTAALDALKKCLTPDQLAKLAKVYGGSTLGAALNVLVESTLNARKREYAVEVIKADSPKNIELNYNGAAFKSVSEMEQFLDKGLADAAAKDGAK